MAGKIVADQLEHSTAGSVDTQFVVNGSAKVWLYYQAQSLTNSLNVTSVTDTSTGVLDVSFANDFSNDDWSGHHTTGYQQPYISDQNRGAGTVKLVNRSGAETLTDAAHGHGTFHGDLA
tara:strand:- start:38 stop:394 length:357 start_codon:yes stop_codon:yes gene_type:complete